MRTPAHTLTAWAELVTRLWLAATEPSRWNVPLVNQMPQRVLLHMLARTPLHTHVKIMPSGPRLRVEVKSWQTGRNFRFVTSSWSSASDAGPPHKHTAFCLRYHRINCTLSSRETAANRHVVTWFRHRRLATSTGCTIRAIRGSRHCVHGACTRCATAVPATCSFATTL